MGFSLKCARKARVVDVVFEEAKRDPSLAKAYLSASLTDKGVAKMRIDSETYDRSMMASILESMVSRSER